jgi:Primase C terminal 2 (PriCT-2)
MRLGNTRGLHTQTPLTLLPQAAVWGEGSRGEGKALPSPPPVVSSEPLASRIVTDAFLCEAVGAYRDAIAGMCAPASAERARASEAIVMQRPAPYRAKDGVRWKDGVHIFFPDIRLSAAAQSVVHARVLREGRLQIALSALPTERCLTCDATDALDAGAYTRRGANRQMYGSSKPSVAPYLATFVSHGGGDDDDDDWSAVRDPRAWRYWVARTRVHGFTTPDAYASVPELTDEAGAEVDAAEERAQHPQSTPSFVRDGGGSDEIRGDETRDIVVARAMLPLLAQSRRENHGPWRNVGMALHHTSRSELLTDWTAWSRESTLHGAEEATRECAKAWSSFDPDHKDEGRKKLMLGSLIKWARDDAGTDHADSTKADALCAAGISSRARTTGAQPPPRRERARAPSPSPSLTSTATTATTTVNLSSTTGSSSNTTNGGLPVQYDTFTVCERYDLCAMDAALREVKRGSPGDTVLRTAIRLADASGWREVEYSVPVNAMGVALGRARAKGPNAYQNMDAAMRARVAASVYAHVGMKAFVPTLVLSRARASKCPDLGDESALHAAADDYDAFITEVEAEISQRIRRVPGDPTGALDRAERARVRAHEAVHAAALGSWDPSWSDFPRPHALASEVASVAKVVFPGIAAAADRAIAMEAHAMRAEYAAILKARTRCASAAKSSARTCTTPFS